MATFHPNPKEDHEPWIERSAGDDVGFRIWHVIFFCFAALLVIVIFICCCVKIRIPRTKQEIEADYQRKKIASKFRQKLGLIKNQEMDAVDLRRALEIILDDLHSDKSEEQLNNVEEHPQPEGTMKAEPQQPLPEAIAGKVALLIKAKNQDMPCPSQSVL